MPLGELYPAVSIVRDAVAIITFSYAALCDWRTREIDPKIWIPALVIGVAIAVYELIFRSFSLLMYVSLAISLMFVGMIAILTFVFRHLGGADFLAIASLVALYPYPIERPYSVVSTSLFPPIIHVMVYYTIFMVLYTFYNLVLNLRRLDRIRNLDVSKGRKLLFVLIAKIMSLDEFLRSRFYFPIYIPGVVNRFSFDVEEDDKLWREKLVSLDPGTPVVALWGIPTVTFIGISLVIYIIVGCSPLDIIFMRGPR